VHINCSGRGSGRSRNCSSVRDICCRSSSVICRSGRSGGNWFGIARRHVGQTGGRFISWFHLQKRPTLASEAGMRLWRCPLKSSASANPRLTRQSLPIHSDASREGFRAKNSRGRVFCPAAASLLPILRAFGGWLVWLDPPPRLSLLLQRRPHNCPRNLRVHPGFCVEAARPDFPIEDGNQVTQKLGERHCLCDLIFGLHTCTGQLLAPFTVSPRLSRSE